jgi:UDP-N-acetylglucosamine diphosphorylase / glucose-1-phosphate thymidylyltransferase / UDP-N-acetylgalactosamine diphosphorylase / glucosamine-1-phosphate N-acetyltransferase / galactosamine-1-phosphate N-acetyltransferase
MKGLIPAAGMGTRLEPITLAIPKELLMIGDKAVIEHVIDAMKEVGVTDITVVVGWRKHAILDYLGSGERLGVKISYVVQDKRNGLAKAVSAGEHVINDESFLVVLGDDFFYPKTFLKEILEFHKKNNADATIGVAKVEDVTRHGIIKPGDNNKIVDIIEKPSKEKAPSNLGCMGVYIFKPIIFEAINKTKPGVKNEYQITDSIKILVDEGRKILFSEIKGTHIDVGTLEDYQKANKFLSERKEK